MDESAKVERRKEQRRLNRSKVRQVLLMVNYVQYKHFGIYAEAVEFYNTLNSYYPTRYDLRKTEKYKEWKMQVTGQTRRIPKRLRPTHPNIKSILNPESPYTGESEPSTPIEINPESRITVRVDSQPSSPDPSEEPSSPDPSEEPSSPDPSEEPSSPDPSEEPSNPSEEPASAAESRKHAYTDNLQLRIPLITHKPKTPTNRCTVSTETLQTVTEEILEESILQPSLYDELAPELVDKIIEDLQSEPDLKDMFTSIEQQLEFEQLGMNIDIDIEDNALDIELDQW